MKTRVMTALLIFLFIHTFSQNKKPFVSINAGVQQTRVDNYLVLNSDEGDYPLSIKPGYRADVNVLFNLTTRLNRLGLVLGYGFNRKGIVQKGMMSEGTPRYYPYTIEFYESYIDAFIGCSYKLINQKKWA